MRVPHYLREVADVLRPILVFLLKDMASNGAEGYWLLDNVVVVWNEALVRNALKRVKWLTTSISYN